MQKQMRDWWDREFKIFMAFGESTTAGGWSSCRERCWVNQLSDIINEFQEIPVQTINLGIGANVISKKSCGYHYSSKPSASERLDRHVLSYKINGNLVIPDLLIISYGLNDVRCGTPVDVFCDELKDIIKRIREKIRSLIVLLGPYYMTDFTLGGPEWGYGNIDILYKYNEEICREANEGDCLFVNLLSAYNDADWLIHHDGVHANDLGHRIVANKIFEVLASNCSSLSKKTKKLERYIPPWRDESTLME